MLNTFEIEIDEKRGKILVDKQNFYTVIQGGKKNPGTSYFPQYVDAIAGLV